MKKIIKVLLILLIIGVITGVGVYLYVFHKPARDVAGEKPAYILTANDLLKQYSEKEAYCNKMYGDKALQLSGTIADITKNGKSITIILENPETGVNCNFEEEYCTANAAVFEKVKVGESITIQGKCDGYDEIMGAVLTRCSVVEESK